MWPTSNPRLVPAPKRRRAVPSELDELNRSTSSTSVPSQTWSAPAEQIVVVEPGLLDLEPAEEPDVEVLPPVQ